MSLRFSQVCTHGHHAPRPVQKKTAALINWRREYGLVDRRVPAFEKTAMQYFRGLARIITDEMIETAFTSGDAAAVVGLFVGLPEQKPAMPGEAGAVSKTYEDMVALESEVSGSMMAQMIGASMASGAIAFGEIPPVAVALETSFTISNPYVAPSAQKRVGWLIQEVRRGTDLGLRDAVAGVIESGYTAQITTKHAAAQIRTMIGLRPDQVRALSTLRGTLDAQGLTGAALERRMAKEAAARLTYRANMIARTEMARAVNLGRHDAWKVARDKGLFAGKTPYVEWVAGLTDRTCPICADLHGDREYLGAVFSPKDEAGILSDSQRSVNGEAPPIHPLCRCATILRLEG